MVCAITERHKTSQPRSSFLGQYIGDRWISPRAGKSSKFEWQVPPPPNRPKDSTKGSQWRIMFFPLHFFLTSFAQIQPIIFSPFSSVCPPSSQRPQRNQINDKDEKMYLYACWFFSVTNLTLFFKTLSLATLELLQLLHCVLTWHFNQSRTTSWWVITSLFEFLFHSLRLAFSNFECTWQIDRRLWWNCFDLYSSMTMKFKDVMGKS